LLGLRGAERHAQILSAGQLNPGDPLAAKSADS
jgi:hypothetical protein